MKTIILLFLLMVSCCSADAQTTGNGYDKELADSLGADEYGMKSYVLAVLKDGTNNSTDADYVNRIFRGHMDNIGRLAKEGKLVVAGPFGENEKNYRGIYIFSVSTVEEARKLVETDPAVTEKLLDFEMYPWYGSAALGTYLEVHEKIAKKKP
ncbi:MAG: YciI family protein [Ignavibacteria bacterium]|nr:YciI family protein [Ignavibacteria bacterium]